MHTRMVDPRRKTTALSSDVVAYPELGTLPYQTRIPPLINSVPGYC